MDTWIAVLTTPSKCFSEKFFQSVSLTDKERKKTSKKNPSKFSKGHVEGDFDNPTLKKLQQTAKIFSLDLQNWDEKDSFSETVFFLKMILMGTRNAVLAGLPKNFLQLPKFFRSASACFEKNHSSGKKSFFLG